MSTLKNPFYIGDQLFAVNPKGHRIKTAKRVCRHCGVEFLCPECNIKQGYGLYCSYRCRALDSDLYPIGKDTWKGGQILDHDKYYAILRNKKYVRRSRIVMEGALGRELGPGEVVHHINGDTKDDSLSNLKLTSDSDHKRYHNFKRYHGKSEADRIMGWREED